MDKSLLDRFILLQAGGLAIILALGGLSRTWWTVTLVTALLLVTNGSFLFVAPDDARHTWGWFLLLGWVTALAETATDAYVIDQGLLAYPRGFLWLWRSPLEVNLGWAVCVAMFSYAAVRLGARWGQPAGIAAVAVGAVGYIPFAEWATSRAGLIAFPGSRVFHLLGGHVALFELAAQVLFYLPFLALVGRAWYEGRRPPCSSAVGLGLLGGYLILSATILAYMLTG